MLLRPININGFLNVMGSVYDIKFEFMNKFC
jgi:hypothetical protein